MNKTVLVETINELTRVLLLNKEALDQGRLADLESLLNGVKDEGIQFVLASVLGGEDKVKSLMVSMEKLLEIEKRLLSPQQEGVPILSDRLTASLNNLKRRPLVLSVMAAVL